MRAGNKVSMVNGPSDNKVPRVCVAVHKWDCRLAWGQTGGEVELPIFIVDRLCNHDRVICTAGLGV